MNTDTIHTQSRKLYMISMNEQPLVSIAMPVFNAEKYLRKSIDSVLNQTYRNIELIIVNDASTDASKDIIQSYSDPRIHYIENDENLGIAKTRNRCIVHSSGKYIAVLDNDDIASPQRIEKQVEFLEENSGYGMCGSYWKIIDDAGRRVANVEVPVSDPEIKTHLLFNNCFCNSSIMIRSRMLREFMYPEDFSMIEDYYFLYTHAKKTKLAILPLYLTNYRVHGQNTSIEKQDAMRLLRRKMDAMILRDLAIPYSESELDIHSAFMNSHYAYFRNARRRRYLQSWLIKLHRHLQGKKIYEMKVAERIFMRRWMMMLRNNHNLVPGILFNRLFLKFRFRYLALFAETVREKFSNTIKLI